MRLAKVLGIVIMAASSACLSIQNGSGSATGQHTGCELTMQSNTLGGACGELVLHNTGSSTMHGWQIEFYLPADGHLVNTWNASFSANANDILVKPLANEQNLVPGQSISMGYCASGAASNIVLTAGLCDNSTAADPTPTTDSNNTVATTQSVATAGDPITLAAVSDANAECPLDSQLAGSQGLLSVSTGSDGVTRCSAERSSQSFIYGTFVADMKAAPASGVVTSFETYATTDTGAQGLAVALDGNDLSGVWITLTHDGVGSSVRAPVNFDISGATHLYSIEWTADSATISVDGTALATFTNDLPPAVGATVQATAYVGTARGAATSFNGLAQGYVNNVRYAH